MKRGVTIIELLIVLGIISLLMQLMLPAVEMARESARRTECANHLRQIGVAMQNHESARGFLPSGGWGYRWVGDPNLGAGSTQPGSWAYQLLPYMEAQGIHDIGLGTAVGEERKKALGVLTSTTLPLLYCPSRRLPNPTRNRAPRAPGYFYNAGWANMLARMDYSGNIGDKWIGWGTGPKPEKLLKHTEKWANMKNATGVILQRTPVLFRQVTAGLSKTYFAGEKVLVANQYSSGIIMRDDQSCWNGDDFDTVAGTQWAPFRDVETRAIWLKRHRWEIPFGSAHPTGFNAVFCDGSASFIAYDIDKQIHKQHGNRNE